MMTRPRLVSFVLLVDGKVRQRTDTDASSELHNLYSTVYATQMVGAWDHTMQIMGVMDDDSHGEWETWTK